MAIINFIKFISDNVDRLFQVVDQFKPDKDTAYNELAEALEEVSKTIEMMNDSINSFTETIFLDNTATSANTVIHNHQQYSKLRAFLTGEMLNQMEESRGHSSRIAYIYDQYLDKKLQSILDGTRYKAFKQFFEDLTMGDEQIIDGIKKLNEWLEQASNQVLTHYRNDDIQQANEVIITHAEDILEDQRLLNESIRKLTRIKFKFSTT